MEIISILSWSSLFIVLLFMSIEDIKTKSVPTFSFYLIFIIIVIIGFKEDGQWNINRMLVMIVVFFLFYIFSQLFYLIKKEEGIGEGDIYLFALLAGLLGLHKTLYLIILSSLLGLCCFMLSKEKRIAFIPCILIALFLVITTIY